MSEFGELPFQQSEVKHLSDTQVRLVLRGLADASRMRSGQAPATFTERILEEAADRLQRLENLTKLLGLLAPGGTAPCTALEEIYRQAATNADLTPVVQDLRDMLEPHYPQWTPALREIEGLPAIEPVTEP